MTTISLAPHRGQRPQHSVSRLSKDDWQSGKTPGAHEGTWSGLHGDTQDRANQMHCSMTDLLLCILHVGNTRRQMSVVSVLLGRAWHCVAISTDVGFWRDKNGDGGLHQPHVTQGRLAASPKNGTGVGGLHSTRQNRPPGGKFLKSRMVWDGSLIFMKEALPDWPATGWCGSDGGSLISTKKELPDQLLSSRLAFFFT